MSFNSLFGLGSHSPDASLEGWWPLQETTGTQATDYSGNTRHGTINGMGANPTVTTGPNGWLTSAFDFDGSDDYISMSTDVSVASNNPRTYGGCVRSPVSSNSQRFAEFGTGTNGRRFTCAINSNSGNGRVIEFGGGWLETSTDPPFTLDSWVQFIAATDSGATMTSEIEVLIDNALLPDLAPTTDRTLQTQANAATLGAALENLHYANVDLAGWFSFSRYLSSVERAESLAGPEPINTVAPTVSGDTTQGSTLTCSPGTWGLDAPFGSGSNGTITYSYQWTRDGVDISGATSSTYATQVADVGADVGCRVRATNDGGYDADADTNSSNTITVVSGSSFQPAWAINATAIAL